MPFGYPPMAGNFIPAGGMMPIRPVVPMPFAVVPPIAPAAIPMNPDTTGYFGNLSPNISEDVVTAILTCCGGFKRLKRPVDPSTGKPKPFALVEFESVADLSRAFRLLQDFSLDHRHLSIKIEGQQPIIESAPVNEEDLKVYEGLSRILIGKKVTGGGSMDWLERRIFQLKERELEREKEQEKEREKEREKEKEKERVRLQQQQQQHQPIDRRDSRQRNYSDLVDEPQFTKTAPSSSSSNFATSLTSNSEALKERERRWDARMREMERELRRDLEKDAERAKRHEKETLALKEHIENYSDAFEKRFGSLGTDFFDNQNANATFFTNREKWRNLRENAKEKEQEIFFECLKIRSEIEANSQQNRAQMQRNFIENSLPIEREELFAYPVDWQEFRGDLAQKFKELCCERVAAYFKNEKDAAFHAKIGEFLFEQLNRKDPLNLMKELSTEPAFLAVCSDPVAESELIVMIIWRWLIYFTSFSQTSAEINK